jgi:hypothetical protein
MLIVPVQAVPNQNFQVSLAQQSLSIAIAQSDYGLNMSVSLDGTALATNVRGEDLNPIVRAPYTGFVGEFVFFDTSGAGDDPVFTGLGDRFQLIYLEASDL